ncbi:MAG: chemotaxis protein CheW [Leptospiraceae bacterium]|nr:chemotaxis protein CheW [Leptospiraceae bacterium]
MSGILGEYTEIFLEESEDQIEELNANLLKMEQDHSNPDIINDIFRAAHSLKSSAAFVGLYNLSDLAHKMENLLQKIREDKISVNVELVNLLFECFDLIKEVIDAVAEGQKIDVPFTDMIEKLENYEKDQGAAGTPAPKKETPVAPTVTTPVEAPSSTPAAPSSTSGLSGGFVDLSEDELYDLEEEMRIRNASAIDIRVILKDDTQMKGSRYALIMETLKPTGVVFKSIPEEEDLLKGIQIEELLFTYITQLDPEEVEKIITSDMIKTLETQIRSFSSNVQEELKPLPLEPEELQEIDEEVKARKGTVYDVRVILKPDTPMKGLRFTLILQNLKHESVVYKSNPEIEILERGTELNSLTFILISTLDADTIHKSIMVDMVEHIDIKPRNITVSDQISSKETSSSAPPSKPASVGGTVQPRREKQNTQVEKDSDKAITKSIKVSSEKLDQLMNNVGELVITNSGFQKIYDDLVRTFGDDTIFAELKSKIDQINRISKDLQSGIMNTRMVPIGSVFNRFSRLVRDLSVETGKKVQLILLGENTELDKKVVDMIGEPLLHLIRNSIDHGLEPPEERLKAGKTEYGTVELNAYQGGNNIMVEIKDDGRGLNKQRILKKAIENGLTTSADAQNLPDNDIYQFIFAPGFSTAAAVTDISGRGVGMNVVNKLIQDFKGKILINTVEGQGSSFTLCFPQALAIIPSILVSMEEEIYAFPLSEVFETIRVNKDQINTLEGHEIINLRGEVLPIYRLNKIIGLSEKPNLEEFPVVIVNFNSRKLGFIVDDLIGKHETVIKTLEKNFRNIPGLTGASIMGDGTIILVLDIQGLIDLTTNLQDYEDLSGEEMLRLNTNKSIDVNSSNKVYKTLNSTNIYNSKLLEMVMTDKSKRKKDKSTERKKPQKQVAKEIPKEEVEVEEIQTKTEAEQIEREYPTSEPTPSQTPDSEELANNIETEEATPMSESTETPTYDEPESIESSETNSEEEERQKAKELLKSFSEQTKQRVESMIDRPIDELLSNSEIRKLESVVNTGMMNAGLVLSQLVGSNVELYMPEIQLTDKELLTVEIRDSYDHFFGLKIRMNGDLNGNLLMIFSEEKGKELANKLLKSNETSDLAKKLSEDSLSVLMEISNIVCASIINSLSNKAKSQIMPSVPELVTGTFREVLDIVKPEKTKFLSMNTEFVYEGDNLIGNLLFLPDFDELVELIAKLS